MKTGNRLLERKEEMREPAFCPASRGIPEPSGKKLLYG
jgi:hypothetical protein